MAFLFAVAIRSSRSVKFRHVVGRQRLHRSMGPLGVLPSRDDHVIAFAGVAKGIDGSALGLDHPEQSRTSGATRTSAALDECFTHVTDRERSPGFDEPSNAKNLLPKPRMRVASLVEPVPDVHHAGHGSLLAHEPWDQKRGRMTLAVPPPVATFDEQPSSLSSGCEPSSPAAWLRTSPRAEPTSVGARPPRDRPGQRRRSPPSASR